MTRDDVIETTTIGVKDATRGRFIIMQESTRNLSVLFHLIRSITKEPCFP